MIRQISYDRLVFVPDVAIGLPYGTKFEIINEHLVPIPEDDTSDPISESIEESAKDNRKIVDDRSAQKLSFDDIHQMKKSGVSGQVQYNYNVIFQFIFFTFCYGLNFIFVLNNFSFEIYGSTIYCITLETLTFYIYDNVSHNNTQCV